MTISYMDLSMANNKQLQEWADPECQYCGGAGRRDGADTSVPLPFDNAMVRLYDGDLVCDCVLNHLDDDQVSLAATVEAELAVLEEEE